MAVLAKPPWVLDSEAEGMQLLHSQRAAPVLCMHLCSLQSWSLWAEMYCSAGVSPLPPLCLPGLAGSHPALLFLQPLHGGLPGWQLCCVTAEEQGC